MDSLRQKIKLALQLLLSTIIIASAMLKFCSIRELRGEEVKKAHKKNNFSSLSRRRLHPELKRNHQLMKLIRSNLDEEKCVKQTNLKSTWHFALLILLNYILEGLRASSHRLHGVQKIESYMIEKKEEENG